MELKRLFVQHDNLPQINISPENNLSQGVIVRNRLLHVQNRFTRDSTAHMNKFYYINSSINRSGAFKSARFKFPITFPLEKYSAFCMIAD